MSESAKVVIFLHVPKTAGTTCRSLIEQRYAAEETFTFTDFGDIARFRNLSQAVRDEYRCLQGHLTFGVHEYLSRPATYLTFLREPVDRLVSVYYFILGNPYHDLHDRFVRSGLSLREMVEHHPELLRDSGQVRLLAGVDVPFGGVTREHLELAKANIEQHFPVVGLLERFDESLLMMAKEFAWSTPYYQRQNTTAVRPTVPELDPETRSAIERHNELDAELWDFARARLQRRIEALGPSFQKSLNAFRRANERRRRMRLSWQRCQRRVGAFVRMLLCR